MTNRHPIEGLMQTAMESLKTMVDVNTILGDPVETPDGAVIVPVSRVSFGFAAGGSEFASANAKGSEESHPFGGRQRGWYRPEPRGLLGSWQGDCAPSTGEPVGNLRPPN